MKTFLRIWLIVVMVTGLAACCILDDDDNDNSPPDVTLVFPGRNTITNTRNIKIRGTATDDSGIRKIAIEKWTAETADGVATWQINYSHVSIGEQYLIITAEDINGRTDLMAETSMLQGVRTENLIDAVVGRGPSFSVFVEGLTVTSSGGIMVLDKGEYAIIGVDSEFGHRDTIVAAFRTFVGYRIEKVSAAQYTILTG